MDFIYIWTNVFYEYTQNYSNFKTEFYNYSIDHMDT